MTVWNRQDWLWRVTSAMGLTGSVSLYVSALLFLSACAPIWRDPDDTLWTPDLTVLFARYVWLPVLLWVLMLARPRAGWLWGAFWALLGVAGTWCVAFGPPVGSLEGAASALLFALGVPTLASSQIWLAAEAIVGRNEVCAACDEVSPRAAPSIWHRAPLAWQVLVGAGGVAVLPCALSVSVFCLVSMCALPWPEWASGAVMYLGLALVAGIVVLLWRELIITGRTWLWWLLSWGLCLLVITVMLPSIVVQWERLQADFPFTLDELEQLIGAGFFAAAAFLLAAAQIWVALKARQLQSGQVARDSV